MFRINTFIECGGYDENFKCTQDYDLWIRMIKYGKFVKLKEKLLCLRIHSNSISSKKNKMQRYYSFFITLKYIFPQMENLLQKLMKTIF